MSARTGPNKALTVAAQIEVVIPSGLVDALRKKYPIRVPKLVESEREIFMAAGFQQCLDVLSSLEKRQGRASTKSRQTPASDGHT